MQHVYCTAGILFLNPQLRHTNYITRFCCYSFRFKVLRPQLQSVTQGRMRGLGVTCATGVDPHRRGFAFLATAGDKVWPFLVKF